MTHMELEIFATLSLVSMTSDGKIALYLNKKTMGDKIAKSLKEMFEGKEVYILISEGRWNET